MKYLFLPLLSATFFTSIFPVNGMYTEMDQTGSVIHYSALPHTYLVHPEISSIETKKNIVSQLVNQGIASSIRKNESLSWMLDLNFKQKSYDPVKQVLRDSISQLGEKFFIMLEQILSTADNNYNDYFYLTYMWGFQDLTQLQSPSYVTYSGHYKQHIHAHPSGLILRLKIDGSFSASIYTQQHTQSIKNYLANPLDQRNQSKVRDAFAEKCNAESCKLIIAAKSTYVQGAKGILVEPVPSKPYDTMNLRTILGNNTYDSLTSQEKNQLSQHLTQTVMELGHLKITSKMSVNKMSAQQINYTLPPSVDHQPHYLIAKEPISYPCTFKSIWEEVYGTDQ